MNGSRNLSLFKTALVLSIALFFKKPLIYLFLFLYLLLSDRKSAFCYLFLLLLSFLISYYQNDFMPFGIVEYQKNDAYIVDKLFYKSKVYSDRQLQAGTVLYFEDKSPFMAEKNDLTKNILFINEKYVILSVFTPRAAIQKRINSFQHDTSEILKRYLYDIYPSEELRFSLAYGYLIYGFIRRLKQKTEIGCVFFILLFCILFRSDFRFFFILISILGNRMNLSKENILSIKIIYVCLFNFMLFLNVSIELILLLEFFQVFETHTDFSTYIFMLESFLFGEINLVYSFLYQLIDKIRILTVILILILFIVPYFEPVFLHYLDITSVLYETDFSIRGNFLFWLFFYISLLKGYFTSIPAS